MEDTVLTVSSRALLRACEALGLDSQAMLDAAGLTRTVIDDPDARIDLRQVRALWKKAIEMSGDPHLGLHAAEAVPLGAYKVLDLIASNAPTVGAALASLAAYFPLINTAVEVPLEVGREVVSFGLRSRGQPAALTREYLDYALAAVFVRTRRALGIDYPLRALELTHPAPASTAEYERVFGCPVRFGAGACRMVIDRKVWDTPAARANTQLFEVLKDHASLLIERLPAAGGAGKAVRAAIRRELHGGDPSLERVARQLAMSPRTLQRKLSEIGETYADVLDEMRHGIAATYLDDREIALSEVAYLLGFAEQSSFTRAFKRWTGMTPSEYRARRGSGRVVTTPTPNTKTR
jgi:AraC-like DNA-binding protein